MANEPSVAGQLSAPHWDGADALAHRISQLLAQKIPIVNLKVKNQTIDYVESVALLGDLMSGYTLDVVVKTITVLVEE